MSVNRGYWWMYLLFLMTSCAKEYSYEGGPVASGFLVKDSLGGCRLISVAGTYKTGFPLTDSNFLTVQVHVTRPGRYQIASDRVNGYSFGASGNFSDTGAVQVKLPGTGTPTVAGTNQFTVHYDSSQCQFPVDVQDTVLSPVMVTNPDHFPLTAGSRWVYDDLSFPGDSIIRTLTGDTTAAGVSYQILNEYKSFYHAANNQYYTRSGADYLRYVSVSGFTSALNFSPSIYVAFNFLKEGLTSGFSWHSDTYSGRTTLSPRVEDLEYSFSCVDADADLVVKGRRFIHVYKIQMKPEVADSGATLKETGEMHTLYYAKGIGLVYAEFFNGVQSHPVLQIRSWMVN